MKYWLFAIVVLVCFACDTKSNKVDTSNVSIDSEFVRFDQRVLNIDTTRVGQELNALNIAYPEFTSLYFTHLLPLKGNGEKEIANNLSGFLNDKSIKRLKHKVDSVFVDFDTSVKPDLTNALKTFKYYFPESQTPDIYTFVSEYAYQTLLFDAGGKDGLGIGLDLFLGMDYPYKALDPKNPAFSDYLTRSFSKEYISKKVIEALLSEKIGNPQKNQMLDFMLNNGKKLYLLDKILQNKPDSIILEMPQNKVDWLKENEKQIYAFFFDKELFYSDNMMRINKYVNPAPTSPGMPAESPGRTANYIGWKIIEAYMKRHPETTIEQLISLKDAQQIMESARYKPAR